MTKAPVLSKKQKRKERNMELSQWGEALAPYLFNFDLLENRLTCSTASLLEMGRELKNCTVVDGKGDKEPYMFIDNGANILAVAHMDATGKDPHFGRVKIKGDEWIFARWVDDRLGVFLLLDVLAQFFRYDILLTSGEETGKSSARQFVAPPGKEYHWMFEPDRMGTDVVHYQYATDKMREAVKAAGFGVYAWGAYSDIASLDKLGCCGINYGIGYEENHGDWARANLNVTLEQTAKMARFFDTNQEVVFPYIPKVVPVTPVTPTYPTNGRNPNNGHYGSATNTSGAAAIHHFDAKFKINQIVKHWDTRRIGLLSTGGYWDEKRYQYTYWVIFRDPKDPNKTTHLNMDEYDLSAWLNDAERLEAKELYPKGFVGESNGRLLLAGSPGSPTRHADPIVNPKPSRRRTETDYDDLMALNRMNEGFAFDPMAADARYALERKMFGGDWIESHSEEIPWDFAYYLQVKLAYGVAIYTTSHSGTHKGMIDCQFPLVVKGEGDYWWVRFERADKSGMFVDLIAGKNIAVQPLTGVLPNTETDLTLGA